MLPVRPTTLLVLFAVLACATATPPLPPAPAPPAGAPAPSAEVAADSANPVTLSLPPTPADTDQVYQGWRLFHIHCFRCHGFDAEGGGAPDLRETVLKRLTRGGFVATVLGGRPVRGMPSWAEVLSPPQAELIYQYVVERGVGRLPPGPPPRRPG